MKNWLSVIVIVLIGLTGLYSQGLDLTDRSDDSSAVRSIWDTWSLRVFTQQKSLRFSIVDRNSDTRTRFTPNNRYSVGLGMTYKWISFDLGINIKPKDVKPTRRLNLAVTVAFNRNIMTLLFQRYKGFDVEDNLGSTYDFRSDIVSHVAGFTFLRAQPDRILSLKSLTSGFNVSRKSTGMFAYGAYWYWDRVRADSALVPLPLTEFYTQRGLVDFSRQISLGAKGGYAYSLLLPKDFFIFLSAFPGIGLNVARLESDKGYASPPFPALRLSTNSAIGYTGPKFYAVFSINALWNGVPWGDKTRYHYSDIRFKVSVGYRLHSEISFLEKVADFLETSSKRF